MAPPPGTKVAGATRAGGDFAEARETCCPCNLERTTTTFRRTHPLRSGLRAAPAAPAVGAGAVARSRSAPGSCCRRLSRRRRLAAASGGFNLWNRAAISWGGREMQHGKPGRERSSPAPAPLRGSPRLSGLLLLPQQVPRPACEPQPPFIHPVKLRSSCNTHVGDRQKSVSLCARCGHPSSQGQQQSPTAPHHPLHPPAAATGDATGRCGES